MKNLKEIWWLPAAVASMALLCLNSYADPAPTVTPTPVPQFVPVPMIVTTLRDEKVGVTPYPALYSYRLTNVGKDLAFVHFKTDNGGSILVVIDPGDTDTYNGVIPAPFTGAKTGIHYYIQGKITGWIATGVVTAKEGK